MIEAKRTREGDVVLHCEGRGNQIWTRGTYFFINDKRYFRLWSADSSGRALQSMVHENDRVGFISRNS